MIFDMGKNVDLTSDKRTPPSGGIGVARDFAMTLRLHPHIGALLEDVSDGLGMSKTAVLVAALHDYANKHGVKR